MSELPLPSIAWLVFALAATTIYAFKRAAPNTRLRRLRIPLALLACWCWFTTTPRVSNAIVRSLERPYPPVLEPEQTKDALIVVLSSGFQANRDGTSRSELDRAAWERTFAGIRLWRRIGGELLFVGGPAPHGSVADTMADVARVSGVPYSAIRVEASSATTNQNIAFSRDLIASHGESAWLVTSAIHMRRAMAVASAQGLKLRPYACDYQAMNFEHLRSWLPDDGGAADFAAVWHEVIGLAWYELTGRAE